ncbi:MAG: M48 family metallopeptidase [Patescibacteria group bacterium]|jgi:heat shock protein HtpX
MYSHITSNKRKTALLLVVFCAFAIFLLMVLGAVLEIDFYSSLILATAFSLGYSLVSYYLSDRITLALQGAKAISKTDDRELYLLVENLSIASGLPTPTVYLINDPAPNAFATGRDPAHASIAVTTGLLSTLSKLELEGVIAHELSHIKNYDIRLMTLVVVLVGLIMLISDLLIRVNLFKNNDSKESGSFFLVAIAIAFILGLLSPILAQVIRLAISRSREYLADADGVLLTRYPEGLASALQKISGFEGQMKRATHATAHLYISDPFAKGPQKTSSWYQRLFLTHPPIGDRIEKIRAMAIAS